MTEAACEKAQDHAGDNVEGETAGHQPSLSDRALRLRVKAIVSQVACVP
jgi:hypothetical protein